MPWPSPQDYSEAVQYPSSCFQDPELCAGTIETDRLGLPKPIAGGFAVVYRVRTKGKSYAVRCFLSEVKDLQERYYCIEAALHSANLPYFVSFSFLKFGIRVRGQWYPALKMEWTEGISLIEYVRNSLPNPEALKSLANEWEAMCGALKGAGIAHGDLQHGNVLISNGKILLIDYDGMYVPSLQGKPASELGHRHYQHPQRRPQHFDSWLDGFAASSILASILAFYVDRSLWDKAKAGDESLLFRKEDYESPSTSATLAFLRSHNDHRLRQIAGSIEGLIGTPLHQIGTPRVHTLGFDSDSIKYLPPGTPWLNLPTEKKVAARISSIPKELEPPPPVPSNFGLPPWLGDNHLPKRSFHASHGLERSVLIFFFVGSLIPSIADGTGGMIASIFLLPSTYLGWRHWIRIRYERHPITLERARMEARLTEKVELLKQAEELRATWKTYAQQISSLQATLGGPELKLKRERELLGTSQGIEMAAARDRFQLARIQDEKNEQELSKSEALEIANAGAYYETRIALLNKSLVDLKKKSGSDQRRIWKTFRDLQSQAKEVSEKYSRQKVTEAAELDREEKEILSLLSTLVQSRQDEINKSLASLQNQHITDALVKSRIIDASIEGVGPVLQERLARFGVRTASDVTSARISAIDGIGIKKAAAILNWRRKVEGNANRTLPKQLPLYVSHAIGQKYDATERDLNTRLLACRSRGHSMDERLSRQERKEQGELQLKLQQEESRAQAESLKILAMSAKQEHSFRVEIRMEEESRDHAVELVKENLKQRRNQLLASRTEGERRLNQEVAAITEKFKQKVNQATATCEMEERRIKMGIRKIREEFESLGNSIRRVEMKAAEIDEQMKQFENITFGAYLAEVVSFR